MSPFQKNLILLMVSAVITFAVAEVGFRTVLFSNMAGFEKLRDPSIYAKIYPDEFSQIFSDDYWKLYYLFDGEEKPPENPHPLLGWVGDFDRKTLVHNQTHQIKKRRPVLLYGDSFAQCVNAECFQDHLNTDTAFSNEHYFLNYGVGGFGVGQIYTLFNRTVDKYEKPFVVFSLMTRDLERTPLSNRIGQKLFYQDIMGELVLKNTPIKPDPQDFFEENPPQIPSYVFRLFNSTVFKSNHASLKETCSYKERMRHLNAQIIRQTVKELKEKDIDFVFLVFNPLYRGKGDWRHVWLRDLLHQEKIPHMFTWDILEKDNYYGGDYSHYEQVDNGHPTSYQNQLISNTLKQYILGTDYRARLAAENSAKRDYFVNGFIDQFTVEAQMENIRSNVEWFANVSAKAIDEGKTTEEMLRKDAEYILKEKLTNSCEYMLFN